MQLPEKLMPLAANGVAVVLRTEGDPAAVMGLVRRAVEQHDSREVIYGVQTLESVMAGSLAARRITMILLGESACPRWFLPRWGSTALFSSWAAHARMKMGCA